MAYESHTHWRIRFLEGDGDAYALRHVQFRWFSDADPVSSCGTVEECRAAGELVTTYTEQAEGTRAVDLFLYGPSDFDAGWASLTHAQPLPEVSISRYYASGRGVAFIGLIATTAPAAPTQISRFAIDFSDDGETWTELREFETDPVWAAGEERVFALPNADRNLPIFSFRANWREPMAERLAFLTDVLAGTQGAEQRRSVRQTPRRTFEADFLLTGRERTFWDLFINALGGGEVAAPLYWEMVTTTATLTATVDDRIEFDTSYREWEYHAGYLAMLIRDSALDYEIVEIIGVDAGGVDLAGPVTRSWPKGTKLLPLRRAVLDQVGDVDHQTAGVGLVTAQLRVVGPNPWTPEADASPVYEDLPVFLSEPNWVEALSVQQGREIDLLDTSVGLTYQSDATGRVLLGQAHRWFLPGRQKLAEFRDLIYRHRGRAGSFWLPTFKADFRLVNSPGAGDTQIEVENVGYGYTGGPTSGREYIAIKHDGGTILRKIVSVIPGSTTATEKLNLDAALGLALSPGQVRRISFADTARFDTDEFEIIHYGGVDAHHDSSAMFRTFKNTRTAPLPISDPAPTGVMNALRCGEFTNRAICFALDRSSSMDTNDRMVTLKAAMEQVFELLSGFASGYIIDIAVVTFGSPGSTMTRRNASSSDVAALNTFVQGLTTGASNTDFRVGANAAAAFFNATDADITDRFLYWLTDGEPTPGDPTTVASEAGVTLDALALPVERYGINIDLADTTYTAYIDNTPSDGIPVVEGSDVGAILDAVLGAF